MAVHNPSWHVDIADLSQDALSLAGENIVAHRMQPQVRAVHSDLFSALRGERYDLIVSNPPYVAEDEYIALGAEYGHEPKLAFTAGADGLDVVLEILDQAAAHLTDAGVLIVEVGESKQALVTLLPNVPFHWVEFKAGPIGVFVLRREDLLEHIDTIHALATARR
jgi:ribosomal protein L3 glutamine methyltransferase